MAVVSDRVEVCINPRRCVSYLALLLGAVPRVEEPHFTIYRAIGCSTSYCAVVVLLRALVAEVGRNLRPDSHSQPGDCRKQSILPLPWWHPYRGYNAP